MKVTTHWFFLLMTDIADIFSQHGALATLVPGFKARSGQCEMAQAFAQAMRQNEIFVSEAGTGTGKTFAYLVPALLSGGKVIISTGTKTLQDQLFNKDLPLVRKALKVSIDVALLKGRSNYLCPLHLKRTLEERHFNSKEDAAAVRRIAFFAKTTTTGDKSECTDVNENSPVWAQVTSTRDNCLGQDCPLYKDCFVIEARKRALAADLVVVNHHLFFADVMLRDEGLGELLPTCNTVIFDEAHQLPNIAGKFFGSTFSTSQVTDLFRDIRAEVVQNARDASALTEQAAACDKAARDFRLSLKENSGRFTWEVLQNKEEFHQTRQTLEEQLQALCSTLEIHAERTEELAHLSVRALELHSLVHRWPQEEIGYVRWVEVFSHSLQLLATPLDIAPIFRRQIEDSTRAWIFTSATLTVRNSFDHYCRELGLDLLTDKLKSAHWQSPFDYPNHAVLYVNEDLPNPNAEHYLPALVEKALPLIEEAQGGVFFLCTSLKAMRRVHELLANQLAHSDKQRPLLLQGETSKNDLLNRFRQSGNAVLVASQSFWEGVDVQGEALSMVIIDKIPFTPPDDPVLAARIKVMEKNGGNPFMSLQIPHAVITLKQGAGRLIRSENDRGVLMIGDSRLIHQRYGQSIWRSLPPMKRCRQGKEVLEFLRHINEASNNSAGRGEKPNEK